MISIIDVTKSYQVGARQRDVLRDLSLEVRRGDFVVIVGRSGAGKSTLLGVLGGLLRPSRGRVLLDGLSVWETSEAARAQLRMHKIGFVFQSASVIGALTVLENVLLPAMLAGQRDARATTRATELVKSVGLGDQIDSYPEQLSGGERRRVAIAGALMNDPAVLIADEPTGDLDPQTERLIMDQLARQNRTGAAVVIVTHNHHLAQYATRLFHMNAGRLVEVPQRDLSGWGSLECPLETTRAGTRAARPIGVEEQGP
jgi:putative ABC transport system ATP-binding protein